MMKVCFILTHIPNPRMNKRIEAFNQVMEREVICARRASQNIWEPECTDVKHTIFDVDLPKSSQIIKRIMVSTGFRKKLYAELKRARPTIIYSAGMDTLMVAVKYKKKYGGKIIFEVSDLRESFIEKPKNRVKKILTYVILKQEKSLFSYIDNLVITSPKFYDLHYHEIITKDKTLFIPNVPDTEVFKNYKRKMDGVFTIGFIGGIRYLQQMKMLVDAANRLNMNVLFAGAGGTSDEYLEITEYCKGMSNIQFTGRYDYGKDIAGLYGRVDCVYSVYDADNANVRIALPNKLYEAIYCELPIIVSKGTYLSELVGEWNVGVAVGHKNQKELESELHRLCSDKNYYNSFVKGCRNKKELINLDQMQKKLITRLIETNDISK